MAADVLANLGRVDVLVNNAGATQVMPFALIDANKFFSYSDSGQAALGNPFINDSRRNG
jgi:NAD(P)-dependent dehydrogenase (short-subunit alcohol dehydrogenase family)